MTDATETPSVLIAEDDRSMRTSLIDLMEAAGWRVEAVPRAEKVAERMAEFQPDVILSDVRMPGMSGLDLLASLNRQIAPPLVLISAHGDIPMATQAIKDGAYGFIEKPYEPRRLLNILSHASDQHRMRRTTQRLKDRLLKLSGLDRILLGSSAATRDLRDEVLDLADINVPVLLQGETGTGKELVARALRDLGPRADGPFLALNCATLSADSFEEDMFGREGGARGRLLSADGGTLFLDEIGACPMPVQAALLRVLEEGEVRPLGSTNPVPVSFRIISATNDDAETAVAVGRLRKDLLFRINRVVCAMPTLRERRDDLLLLTTHFMEEFARVYETTAPEITQDDLAALMTHDWPGNARELRNVAERRVLAARRGGGSMAKAIQVDGLPEDVPVTLRESVAAYESELISKAIKAHEGRMDAVAEALGIGRRTLNEKIVKLGLDKEALL